MKLCTSAMLATLAWAGAARAQTTWFLSGECDPATSYMKHGPRSDDLTAVQGVSIRCDSVVMAQLIDGRFLIQFAKRGDAYAPIGFAGDWRPVRKDAALFEMAPDLLYLPVAVTAPPDVKVRALADGHCLIEGSMERPTSIACTGRLNAGDRKTVYRLDVAVTRVQRSRPPSSAQPAGPVQP